MAVVDREIMRVINPIAFDSKNPSKDAVEGSHHQMSRFIIPYYLTYPLFHFLRILKNPLIHLTPPPIVKAIPANKSGYITSMDVRKIGLSLVSLKAGRVKSSDTIDHSIGLSGVVQIGQFVSAGDPLAIAQVRHLNDIDYLKEELSNAINITEDIQPNGPGSENELIYDILNPNPS